MISDYDAYYCLQKILASDKRKKPIALITGAGISYGFTPLWDDLIDGILNDCIELHLGRHSCNYQNIDDIKTWLKQLSVYDQAHFIKNVLKDQYLYLLHSHLYGIFSEAKFEDDTVLLSVAKLCCNPRIKAVITYNWDNLLEEQLDHLAQTSALSTNYRSFHSIHGKHLIPTEDGQLPIYHVHGYIPRVSPYLSSYESDIVFSLEEYNLFSANLHSWQSIAQLYYLQNYICLFIGTSLTDMNMLRLLSLTNSTSKNSDIFFINSIQSVAKNKHPDANDEAKTSIYKDYLGSMNVGMICPNAPEQIKELINTLADILVK